MFIKKNDQEKIKTIFYTKFQIIKEYWFKINSTLKEIFDYFEKHIKEEGFRLKSNYNLFDKNINESYTISELIKKDKNDSIISGEIWIEIEEEIFFDDENDDIFCTILQPKLDPFELIEYNSLKSEIKIIQCPQDIFLNSELNKISKESAFCNSNNALFLSGGEVSGKTLNNFWIINKNNYKIIKHKMPISKKNHSMLYIADNFIFITGGDTLNTIIYDIETKDFIEWANLNKIHFQPGIFIYGDYIYAFSALTDENKQNNYFERTNLTSKVAKWEIIYPQYDENKINFNSHFFGISKYLDGNILFVGGEKNNPNYLYNPMNNIIIISNKKNLSIPFWDKSFYKINKKYNICIPLNFNNNYQLIFLNKETESLEEIKYDKKTGHVYLDLEKEDEQGNIYIQSKINKINDKQNLNIKIGICPKKLMKKKENENENNNKDNNIDINYDEERIIIDNCCDNPNNTDYSDQIKSNKNFQKKSYLYISDSIIDEQTIKREVDLVNKQNTKNENLENDENKNSDKDIDEDITKEEYIFIEDINPGKENEDNIPLISNHQKQFLYIPNSVINDHIINRELSSFNKNDNYKKNENNNNYSEKKNLYIDELIPEIKIDKEDEIVSEGKMDENEDEDDEKIIINYGNDDLDEKDDYLIKQNPNDKYLYIPYSLIDDHTIKRKVGINYGEIEFKKSLKKKENPRTYLQKTIESNRNTIPYKNSKSNNTLDIDLDNDILKGREIINYYNTEQNQKRTKINKNTIKVCIPKNPKEEQIIRRILSNNKNTI